MSLTGEHMVDEFACYGYFRLRLFAEGHADGVAQSVGKQGADAQCRLDASVLAVTRLGHAEMEGKVHPFPLHDSSHEPDGLHHDDGIARLDGDHHVAEVLLHADAQELHARLHHPLGRVAVARHDAVGERAVVHTDAQGGMVCLADVEQGDEACAYLLQFACILLVGIFQVLEGACGIDVVARVDAHLLGIERSYFRHLGVEVDVCHEGRQVALRAQGGVDVAQVLSLCHSLGSEPYVLSSGVDDSLCLCDGRFGVARRRVGHRLDAYGVGSPHRCGADLHLVRRPAFVVE